MYESRSASRSSLDGASPPRLPPLPPRPPLPLPPPPRPPRPPRLTAAEIVAALPLLDLVEVTGARPDLNPLCRLEVVRRPPPAVR
jgi:hypothetical protein